MYVKLNRDANCFLPVVSKDCFMRVEKYFGLTKGTIGYQKNTDNLLEKLSRKNHENGVYQKLNRLDVVIFRVHAFGVRVHIHKIYFFVTQY